MKGHIGTILKKELSKFFGDKRTAFSTILLPGILIFFVYSFMGDALTNQYSVDDDYKTKCYVENMPENLQPLFQETKFSIKTVTSEQECERIKEKITENEADILLIFPENFEAEVQNYDAASLETAPNVSVYYNSAEVSSSEAYSTVTELLNAYESTMTNKFDINSDEKTEFDLASKEDTTGNFFAGMLPMLLLIFLYSGVMGVAPDSIAGEKERGTISTLLVTPVNRSHIAIGKIISISIIAVLSAASSTIGTISSFPKLLGAAGDEISGNVYGMEEYACLAAVMLVTVLIIVAVLGCISTFAKTIKEAQTYCTPLMIIVMLIGITAMFGAEAKTGNEYYVIPLYNSVQCMISIFKMQIVPMHVVITCISNLVYTAVGIFVMTKMFHSEKIMFSK